MESIERHADLRIEAMLVPETETAADERFHASVRRLVDVGHQAVAWRIGVVERKDFVADAGVVRGDVPCHAQCLAFAQTWSASRLRRRYRVMGSSGVMPPRT